MDDEEDSQNMSDDLDEMFEGMPGIGNFLKGTMNQAKQMADQMRQVSNELQAVRHPTLIIIKPPAHHRGLAPVIIDELKRKNYHVRCIKVLTPTKEQVEEHYAEHKGKDFFEKIVSQMTAGPVTVAVVGRVENNDQVVADIRKLVGATDPKQAEASTIRARYGTSIDDNVIHASDSEVSARREIKIWLPVDKK